MGNLKVRRIAVLGLAALLLSACAGNGEFRQSTVPVPPPADPVSSQLRTVLEHTDLLVFSHPIPEAKIMQPVSGKRAGIVEAASAINDGEVPSMVTPKGWYAWLGGIARGTGQAEGADATAAGHETARSVLGDPDLPAKLSARFTRELRGEGLRAKRIHADEVVSRKDMVMLVEVEHVALEGDESTLNPQLRLRVWGHAALVGPTRHVLKDRSFDYLSGEQLRLAEWTRNDGSRLSAEVDAALKDIARQVTGSMFATPAPQPGTDLTPEG